MTTSTECVVFTTSQQRRPHIRTTREIVDHLPRLYRDIATALVNLGEVQIVDEEPTDREA